MNLINTFTCDATSLYRAICCTWSSPSLPKFVFEVCQLNILKAIKKFEWKFSTSINWLHCLIALWIRSKFALCMLSFKMWKSNLAPIFTFFLATKRKCSEKWVRAIFDYLSNTFLIRMFMHLFVFSELHISILVKYW